MVEWLGAVATGCCISATQLPDAGGTDAGPGCIIDGGWFTVGATDPSNPCHLCALSTPSAWSTALTGQSCGTAKVCHLGRCEPTCSIDGGLFLPGQANPDNTGQCCGPIVSIDHWQLRFSAPATVSLTGPTTFLAAGDFDRDGRQDLAATISSNGSAGPAVVVVHNDGVWTDSTPAIYPLPPNGYPQAIAVADLDGDGAPDILVADYLNALEILRNRGDGSFEAPLVVPLTQPGLEVLAVPDLLSPGQVAVVVTTGSDTADGGAIVLFAVELDGGFSLEKQLELPTEINPWSLSLLPRLPPDQPSLIFETTGSNHNDVQELASLGGTLAVSAPIPGGASINGFAVGDINGDGLADLVASNFYEAALGIAVGDGYGGFAPWRRFPLPFGPNERPVLADFEGNGRLAIAVPIDGIGLLARLPSGSLSEAGIASPLIPDYPKYLVGADFNGDEAIDLAVTYRYGGIPNSIIQVLINQCP